MWNKKVLNYNGNKQKKILNASKKHFKKCTQHKQTEKANKIAGFAVALNQKYFKLSQNEALFYTKKLYIV